MGLYLECGKERHMRAQCLNKQVADVRRKQLVAAQTGIEIIELKEKKPAEN